VLPATDNWQNWDYGQQIVFFISYKLLNTYVLWHERESIGKLSCRRKTSLIVSRFESGLTICANKLGTFKFRIFLKIKSKTLSKSDYFNRESSFAGNAFVARRGDAY